MLKQLIVFKRAKRL
jgi:hypothetical protein